MQHDDGKSRKKACQMPSRSARRSKTLFISVSVRTPSLRSSFTEPIRYALYIESAFLNKKRFWNTHLPVVAA